MKKKLEADLMSLAHRVLRLKGKEDINQMLLETQKLYEKLAILKFVEENFETAKPTLTMPEIEEILEKETEIHIIEQKITTDKQISVTQEPTDSILSFEIEPAIEENKPETIVKEEIIVEQEIVEQNGFVIDEKTDAQPVKTQQITLEDLLKPEYRETEFVKKTDVNDGFSSRTTSLNDKLNQTITLGLNDRIAFEKQLFNGSATDLNRVISQLNTFESFQEAKNFIENIIKPDYNYWKDKEMYEERLMELIAKKFS